MALTIKKEIGYFEFGMTNKELTENLQYLNSKLRMTQQRLKTRIDTEMMAYCNDTQNMLTYFDDVIRRSERVKGMDDTVK